MKIYRFYYILLILLGITIFVSCETPTSPEIAGSDTVSNINLTLPKISGVSADIDRVDLIVFGPGLDTIKTELAISPNSTKARGQLRVLGGQNRTFKAEAFTDSLLVFSGSITLTITAGKTISVNIPMTLQVPALTFVPNDTVLTNGSEFDVKLKVNKVDSLTTIGVRLLFDPNYLQVQDLARDDAFLKSNGGFVQQIIFNKDNTIGRVNLVLGVLPASKFVGGSGSIGIITFKTMAAGSCRLRLEVDPSVSSDLGLYNNKALLIPALGLGGFITIK